MVEYLRRVSRLGSLSLSGHDEFMGVEATALAWRSVIILAAYKQGNGGCLEEWAGYRYSQALYMMYDSFLPYCRVRFCPWCSSIQVIPHGKL